MRASRPGSRPRSIPATPQPAVRWLGPLGGGLTTRPRVLWLVGLLVTFIALGLHAWHYRFLTDDAYISFRYARNLSDGFGLVFNPGWERVEGYSNFLWTVLLAGGDRLGIAPDRLANPLSLAATAILWGALVWFAARRMPTRVAWIALVPVALLAATRSIAVWSTGGLETRVFEVLVVVGALRLLIELEAELAGQPPRRRWSGLLFALAALTRPDGLLLALAAFGIAVLVLARRGRLHPAGLVRRLLPLIVLVGGHFVFRRLYYGEWLPNTYYAKVGGRLWWDSGGRYLEAFALEYAMWLWVPLLVLGVRRRLQAGEGHVPLLYAALIVPHALYIAAIGGDHFEFRPLDLYLPFLFLMIADGVQALIATRTGRLGAAFAVLVVVLGIVALPWQSHVEFPAVHRPGFPGAQLGEAIEARRYLDPDRNLLYRLPGLRAIAGEYRATMRGLTDHYVGLRQEEHRLFLATVAPEGRRLRQLLVQGALPRDLFLATGCIGAIPYYSDVRTLDLLGLTDTHVARSLASAGIRRMAHERLADEPYVRGRGVDLWAIGGVHVLGHLTSAQLLDVVRQAAIYRRDLYAADAGGDQFVIAYLPQGIEQARRRMPGLEFQKAGSREFMREFVTRGIAAWRDSLPRSKDPGGRLALAYLLLLDQQYEPARALYLAMEDDLPENLDLWEYLAECELRLGNGAGLRRALQQGVLVARVQQDTTRAVRMAGALARLGPAAAAGP